MPKYKVTVASTRIYATDIEVKADTPEAACELAEGIACGEPHPDKPEGWEPEWEYSDGMGVEWISCDEVADAKA